jgi:molybdate/tungstate transport system substrate-binding protein
LHPLFQDRVLDVVTPASSLDFVQHSKRDMHGQLSGLTAVYCRTMEKRGRPARATFRTWSSKKQIMGGLMSKEAGKSHALAAFSLLVAQPALACVTPTTQQVIVWHAGSLTNAFKALETAFTCQTGIQVTDHSTGSLDLVRQITAGGQAADVVAPADFLDIDLFLKPAGYVDYDIRFAETKMVLGYLQSDLTAKGYTVADGTPFNPPTSIPDAVPGWYNVLLQPDIAVGETNAFLDPTGYRAPMIFRLAQSHYGVSNLYDNLLDHLVATAAQGSPSITLGKGFDFQLVYEVSAYASAQSNPDYHYVNIPDEINLGDPTKNDFYRQAEIAVPDLWGTGLAVIPGHSVTYGVTIMKTAENPANAIAFVQYLLGSNGQAALRSALFKVVSPAKVSRQDYRKLPNALRAYVTADGE